MLPRIWDEKSSGREPNVLSYLLRRDPGGITNGRKGAGRAIPRAFVLRRPSDAGPLILGRSLAPGRHPKPFTTAVHPLSWEIGSRGWRAVIPFHASVLPVARDENAFSAGGPLWSDARRVEAKRDEGARANSRESARHQDWPQQLLGEAFDPRGEVHGRATVKVEPVGGADVANELTEMQANPESNLGAVGI